jgi:hypothetical protein
LYSKKGGGMGERGVTKKETKEEKVEKEDVV